MEQTLILKRKEPGHILLEIGTWRRIEFRASDIDGDNYNFHKHSQMHITELDASILLYFEHNLLDRFIYLAPDKNFNGRYRLDEYAILSDPKLKDVLRRFEYYHSPNEGFRIATQGLRIILKKLNNFQYELSYHVDLTHLNYNLGILRNHNSDKDAYIDFQRRQPFGPGIREQMEMANVQHYTRPKLPSECYKPSEDVIEVNVEKPVKIYLSKIE